MSDNAAAIPVRSTDPRAERSRRALLAAAIDVVVARGTTDVPLTEIVKAAGVSRQAAYLHYRDRDDLLVEAALDLLQDSMNSRTTGDDMQLEITAVARHFDDNRRFYRAIVTGSCFYEFNKRVLDVMRANSDHMLPVMDAQTRIDVGNFFSGGAGNIITSWIADPHPSSTPEQIAKRIHNAHTALAAVLASDEI